MRRISFLILASCIGVLSFQTASAQFPVKVKIPKPKPQPTPTETAQPAPRNEAQPTQPQPESRNAPKPTASAGNSAASEDQPTIAKDSVQVTAFTFNVYRKNYDTWSWVPRIQYRVNGPIDSGSQLYVEFTLPGAGPWVKFDCRTGPIQKGHWWKTECGGRDLPEDKGTTYTGPVNFAVKLRNELAGLQNCNVFNGVASPRCDFIVTVGTLSFAAGETSKSFSVAIIDDSYAEGTESFTVSLNNPSGASLGSPSTTTVMIVDNETTTGPNPIDNTNFFVRQQYLDFLGREPDPPGFAGSTSTINNCSGDTTQCDRIHVSQLFFQSEEFQSRGYFVYRFYDVALGRKPDYAEFVVDLAGVSGFLDNNQLEAAKVAFIADFMTRPAFANTYNPLTNQQYVDALLNTAV